MNSSMKSLLFLLFYAIPIQADRELCDEVVRQGFKHFYVEHSIRFGDYIGIYGRLSNEDSTKQVTLAIRLYYWHKLDATIKTNNQYLNAVYWNHLKKLFIEYQPFYVFTVRHIQVLNVQILHETIIFVGNKSDNSPNKSIALTFDYLKVEKLSDDETNEKESIKTIYEPTNDIDESGPLDIKLLFHHFPYPVTIKAVFVFEFKTKRDSNSLTHFAIVYTEEVKREDKKTHYFRHYLTSYPFVYEDSIEPNYLIWSFDEKKDFCESMNMSPNTVLLIRKMTSDRVQIIYFAEFYGSHHRLMKLTFKISPFPNENGTDNYYLEQVGDDIPNFDALINCDSHPIFTKVEKILCKDNDYIEEDEDILQSMGETTANSLIYWFAIVLTIGLMVLMVVVVFLEVHNHKPRLQEL